MDITPCSSFDEMKMMVNTSSSQNQIIGIVRNGFWESINIKNPHNQLPAGSIQTFLDNFMAIKGADKIDYIHGDDVMISLCQEPGNIGFYLPAMKKGELFKTIILEGALPRKTFSMGEASDKRFYFECRQIQYI